MASIIVGFADERIKKEYEKVKQEDPKLFRFLDRATDDLKRNPQCGIKIPKSYWPGVYVKKYGINNL